MLYNSDFKEFLILLNKYKVSYLIIGGYAISVYSHPTNTDDIDIWIKVSEGNAKKMLKVLEEFGFGNLNITKDDLTKRDFVVQLGFPPNRIDILTGITGLNYDTAYKNRTVRHIAGIGKISFISRDDLIKNKQLSKRVKDKQALEWLRKYGKSRT
jgi:hypothetical protein